MGYSEFLRDFLFETFEYTLLFLEHTYYINDLNIMRTIPTGAGAEYLIGS
jgi:hypothetical protein